MKYSIKFLSKFFCIIAMSCWSELCQADKPEAINIGSGILGTTLCPSGQYVYKCGNYRVGFNWLKGMTKTTLPTDESNNQCPDGYVISDDNSVCTITTKNYYISDDTSVLFEQMRKFFGGESIKYCINDSCDYTTDSKTDRDTILDNVCNPLDSSIVITCATCPNSAKIAPSTYTPESTQIRNGQQLSIAKNWQFHTIADCYMNEFTDSTGTFKYVNNNTTQNCYYVNTNPDAMDTLRGDSIENFATSSNAPILLQVAIPSSGIGIRKKF